MASTFKLPLVMAVLSRVDRGKERLDRAIAFRASDLLAYSPIVGLQPHGGTLTVAALCAAAIEHSDNAAANLLLRTVGGPAGVTAYLRSIGDPVTRLDRTEPALNDAIPGDVRDTTTPEAMASTLVRLVRDPILSAASKKRLFGWLRGSQTGAARIRAGVPAGWTVGDKTGTTNTGANDVAILWPRTGAPIVLAIYFAEVKGSDAARDAVFGAVARNVDSPLSPRLARSAASDRSARDDVRQQRVEPAVGDARDVEQLVDRCERAVRGRGTRRCARRGPGRCRGSSRACRRRRR